MFDLRDFAARTQFVILSEVSSANAVEESRTASRLAARVSALAGTKPVPVSLPAERSILSSDSAQDSVGFFEAKPPRRRLDPRTCGAIEALPYRYHQGRTQG